MDSTLISYLVLAVLPFIALVASYLYKIIVAKLPEAQRKILEQIVQYAVQMAEQMGGSGQQKKAIALQVIEQMYQSFKLPVPDEAVINTMVESAVFLINQMVHTTPLQGNTYTRTSMPIVKPN
jgi:LL-H family phage holin